jgi:D-3-phosphoglycerate dehydrogenase
MMANVLIADKMDKIASEILRARGLVVDDRPGLAPDELSAIIGQYDAVAVRSTTKINAATLARPGVLRVIGRAGIGVDTIDVAAATAAGIVVMNTPYGNSVTTAEHTVAMIMSLARQIPQAHASTHAGKWEKSAFLGTELMGKTLGLIGCGNIGRIVADRASGLKMKVIAYDPFLTPERARDIGIHAVDFDTVLRQADFISVHTPMTDQTRGMINHAAMAKMKKGVRLINCARGGLIVEADLLQALECGQVAGAALDVFEQEPAKENILFGHPRVICTPHLGASTAEAQVNVAQQIAEQIADFLLTGAIRHAVNMPSIDADEAPKLKPFMKLGAQLGAFMAQMVPGGYRHITAVYRGEAARLKTKMITAAMLGAVLKPMSDRVNLINAADIARAQGIEIREEIDQGSDAGNTVKLEITTLAGDHASVTGSIFNGDKGRIVSINHVPIEAAIAPLMLFIRNQDKPGMIGALGTLLAAAGCNIADFRLGRVAAGGDAVALVAIDQAMSDEIFAKVQHIPQIHQVARLRFD